MRSNKKFVVLLLGSILSFVVTFIYSWLIAFFPLIRNRPSKKMNEWLIVFFLKSYIASILDTIISKKGYIVYPVNLFKIFDISVLFSYLLFPLSCVYYNQLTRNSGIIGASLKALFFSVPMSVLEFWLERNTKLIRYKKGWNIATTFASMTGTFLLVRGLIALVRQANKMTKNANH
jgi:hypothetical protein